MNLDREMMYVCDKVRKNLSDYNNKFPKATSVNNNYQIGENNDWTEGFWVGLVWMCYEYSKDEFFKTHGIILSDCMCQRIEDNINLDHHDLGFLYSLSTVAAYKITGQLKYKEVSLMAANKLISRFNDKGQFIQAWGKFKDPKENRLIVDSLLNLPLLYWAYEISQDETYKKIADMHYNTVIKNVVRENFTTYHTYYFDYETGRPLLGITAQGNRDNSCWARGQSWALTGITLNSKYQKELDEKLVKNILKVILDNIPHDGVVYWDFDFDDKNPSQKDVGTNAIIACGLLAMHGKTKVSEDYEIAKKLINSIVIKYINHGSGNCITTNSVYSFHQGKGVGESCLWSEYFYMEALMHLNDINWKSYW